MEIKYKIIYVLFFLTMMFYCSQGDIIKVDKQVDSFYEIRKSGNLKDLKELIHPNAPSDLNIDLFQSMHSTIKSHVGDYLSHERDQFNFNASGDIKLFTIIYKVKYTNDKEMWEKFVFRKDSDEVFRLVGYTAHHDRDEIIDKKE